MCRMLLFTGNNEPLFESLLKSLREVCSDDPLHELQHKPFLDHKDGWGYLDSGNRFLAFEKFLEPVFRMERVNFSGDIRLIHARNATEGEPLTLTSTHPFHLPLEDYDLYLGHNGWINKSKLTGAFSKNFMETRSDSEVFLNLLGTFRGTPIERLKSALEQVYSTGSLKSGLNIFLFAVNRRTQSREVYIYSDARDFDLYHRFFLVKGENCYAVVSSSLLKAKGFPSGVVKIPLSPGIIYSMGSSGCKAIEKVNGCRTVENKEAILL